jgi:cation diffusion facilitator family transporter
MLLPHQENHAHGILHFHAHGPADPSLLTTEKGIWAVKWSFVGLMTTALIQMFIVWYSGSVALLADTVHNFGDAATSVPLWIAFALARRPPNKRLTYGYGRAEDLAGVAIVIVILLSAVVAGYESFHRFFHPMEVEHLWAVAGASLIGFLGNELVSIFRIRVGKEINSAALVADGYHAQADGLTSLAVLLGAVGIYLGYDWADPLIGGLITIAIVGIVWQSGKAIFSRLLDGVDPKAVDDIRETARQTKGVEEVTQVRVRWLGHRLHAEINVSVDSHLSVEEGHQIAREVQHQLMHRLSYLSNAIIHVDPLSASGEEHHPLTRHETITNTNE